MLALLDQMYRELLRAGFIVIREAIDANDMDWVSKELEFLHNIPSLIGETNELRHEYFWLKERPAYIQWISESGSPWQQSRMRTYYAPILQEMKPVIAPMCSESPD